MAKEFDEEEDKKQYDENDKKLNEYGIIVQGVFEDARKLSKIIFKNENDIKKHIEDHNLTSRTEDVLEKLRLLNYNSKVRYFKRALGITKKKKKKTKKQNKIQENPLDDTSNTIPEFRDLEIDENEENSITEEEKEGDEDDYIEDAVPDPNENDPENFVTVNGKTYNITNLTEREINEIQYPNQENAGGQLSTTRRVNEPPQKIIPSDLPQIKPEPVRERPVEQRTELRTIPNTSSSFGSFNPFGPIDYNRFGANSNYINTYARPQVQIPQHLIQQQYMPQRQFSQQMPRLPMPQQRPQQQQILQQRQNREEPMSETGSESVGYRLPTRQEIVQIKLENERREAQRRFEIERNLAQLPTADATHQVRFIPPSMQLPVNQPRPNIQVPQSLLEQSLYNQTRRYHRGDAQPPSIIPYRDDNLRRSKRTDIPTKRTPQQPTEVIDLTHEVIDVEDDEPLEKVNSPERRGNTIPRREVKEEIIERVNEEIQ